MTTRTHTYSDGSQIELGGGKGFVRVLQERGEAEAGAEPQIPNPVREFVDGYEFRGDAGDYTPTEVEREMLEDFAHGLLSEFGITIGNQPAPRKRRIIGKQAHLVDDMSRKG